MSKKCKHVFYYSEAGDKRRCTKCRKEYVKEVIEIVPWGFYWLNSVLFAGTFFGIDYTVQYSGKLLFSLINYLPVYLLPILIINYIFLNITSCKKEIWVRNLE